jgi:nucleotide-binding universal stress UspA family protein
MGAYILPEAIENAEKEAREKNRMNLVIARRHLRRNLKQIVSKGIRGSQYAIIGTPAQSIIDFSHRTGIDLIVMTTHGKAGVKRTILGSVSDEVLREARLPVLIVRP